MDEKGRPSIVERAWVVPPAGRLGPVNPEERAALMQHSVVAGVYEQTEDRESAYEKLKGEKTKGTSATADSAPTNPSEPPSVSDRLRDILGGAGTAPAGKAAPRGRESAMEALAKSAARAIGSQVGREIIRGVFGSILGGRRR